jgi:hypothetical protein
MSQKTFRELHDVADPVWPELSSALSKCGRAQIFPAGDMAEADLCALQVSLRSTLGAIVFHTGGVWIDRFVRLFGSKGAQSEHSILVRTHALRQSCGDDQWLAVGDDVIGGQFAMRLDGPAIGNIFYFAPDTLAWEDCELGYSDFVEWAMNGDLDLFYENTRWPDWRADCEKLQYDQSFHFYPPLWAQADVRSRAIVSAAELSRLCFEYSVHLNG